MQQLFLSLCFCQLVRNQTYFLPFQTSLVQNIFSCKMMTKEIINKHPGCQCWISFNCADYNFSIDFSQSFSVIFILQLQPFVSKSLIPFICCTSTDRFKPIKFVDFLSSIGSKCMLKPFVVKRKSNLFSI